MSIEDEWISRLPRWVVVLFGTATVAFFAWSLVGGYGDSHARNAHPRYTIGYVTRTAYAVGPSSHSVVFYTYAVGTTRYEQSSTGDLPAVCTRCLVKFAADDPQNVEFFNRLCLPDSIKQAPALGWEEPPFLAPTDAE
jgi:hypothetical protein